MTMKKLTTAAALLQVVLTLRATVSADTEWLSGFASCYGDYVSVMPSNSVACGMGSFMEGEDFTYTTAMCSTWAQTDCGSCYEVECTEGKTGGSGCASGSTFVRVVDQLGNDCSGSGQEVQVFDLNNVAFNSIATENGVASDCSGEIYVRYRPVDCAAIDGLINGGVKVGLLASQCDPWCPPFWFSSVGGSGGLYSVKVSSDGGASWNVYERMMANGARWQCQSGQGSYVGQPISFELETCAIGSLPSACEPSGEVLTLIDALPANWCANGASPCTQQTFELAENFGAGGGDGGDDDNASGLRSHTSLAAAAAVGLSLLI